MTLKTKLIILIGFLIFFLGVVLVFYANVEKAQIRTVFRRTAADAQESFLKAWEADKESARLLATDYTIWDEMVNFVQTKDPVWGEQNIDAGMNTFRVDAAFVFNADFALIYEKEHVPVGSLKEVFSSDVLKKIFATQQTCSFYAKNMKNIFEIHGAGIHPTADDTRVTPARGYFIVVRVINQEQVNKVLENLINTKAVLILSAEQGDLEKPQLDKGISVFSKELLGWDGQPQAFLRVHYFSATAREYDLLAQKNLFTFAVLLGIIFLAILFFFIFSIHFPLHQISRALAEGDTEVLDQLKTSPDELGDLARLIESFFEQKKTLTDSESKYSALVEQAKEAVVIIQNRRICFANKAAEILAGCPVEKVLGQEAVAFIAPEDRPTGEYFLAKFESGEEQKEAMNLRSLRADGAKRDIEVTTSIIQYNQQRALMAVVRDVTERRQMEETIRENEQRYRNLFENLNVGIYRNTLDGQWIEVNLFHSKIFGYDSPDELKKKSIVTQYQNPDDRQAYVDEIKQKGFVFNKEIRLKKKDGTPFWVSVTSRAHYDQKGNIDWIDGVLMDITWRKNAEAALWESEEKYRQLIQSISSIILQWDMQGMIRYINPFACKIFGYAEEELLGRRVQETIVPTQDEEGRDLHEMMQKIVDDPGKYAYNENENRRKDGTRVWIAWTNKIMTTQSGEKVFLSAGTDVTERRRMEEHIRKINTDMKEKEKALRNILVDLHMSNKSLKQTQHELLVRQKEIEEQRIKEKSLREVAEAATKTKGEFLANMSHEIRTPLNSVLGFVALLRKTDLVGDQRRFADNIYTSSQHLLFLVNDILDYEKAMAGKVVLEKQEFHVREFIKEIIELGETRKEQNQVSWQVEENVPDVIKGDAFRLRQILVNLLNNAFKFTKAGNVHLQVAIDEYPQPMEDGLLRLRFMVADTGIGIPPEKQKNIFEAFMQADSSTTRQYGGAGLGLAISRAYVKLMGGNIWVSSESQKGSKFYFTAVFERGV